MGPLPCLQHLRARALSGAGWSPAQRVAARTIAVTVVLASAACGSIDVAHRPARGGEPGASLGALSAAVSAAPAPSGSSAPSAGASASPAPTSTPVAARLPVATAPQVSRATFSADGASVELLREGTAVAETYALATGEQTGTRVVPPSAEGSPGVAGGTEVTLTVGPQQRKTLEAVAKSIGASIRDAEGATVVTSTTRYFSTDGRRFLAFDDGAGQTLVRLDTGARGTFSPWTTGRSGMGQRTGGVTSFEFGPNVDRVVVQSISLAGASIAMDEARLLNTRTMQAVGPLPGTCQPFAFAWSPSGALVARNDCWTRRLRLSDGNTAALVRSDETFEFLGFSLDEAFVAGRTADGGLLVERTRSGEHVLRVPGPNPMPVTDLLFSRDGKRLVVARGSAIDVWDLPSGEGRTVDTRAPGEALILTTDDDATSAWTDDRWITLSGAPPIAAPPSPSRARSAIGSFDPRTLVEKNEGFEVGVTIARPGTSEVLIALRRTHQISVMDEVGTEYTGTRLAIVDTRSGSVTHVFDSDTLGVDDWAWTDDGAHLVTREDGLLAVYTPDLRLEEADAQRIPLQPTQPIGRLGRALGTRERITKGAQLLSAIDGVGLDAPRAIDPSLRFIAFAVGPSVAVVDRTTGARLLLSCAEVGVARGCLATTEAADGRWAASASIVPSIVAVTGARQEPDLVRAFFAAN